MLYERGLEKKLNGLPEEASELWFEYARSAVHPGFKAAHEFISLVTAHQLRNHYEAASEFYLEGLRKVQFDNEIKEVMNRELTFLSPLLGQREARSVQRRIDERDDSLFEWLLNFWNERSLTPSDPYNERLLEHWERVNYALQNYNTSSRSLFDDRGGIYIQYGKPSRVRSGVFMYNPGFASYIISARMDDGRSGGDATDSAINTTMYLNTLYQVREHHQYPSFEVWVYTNLTDGSDNVVYLFGNDTGGNVMRLKRSVDDFISSAAYSSHRNNPMSMGLAIDGGGGASAAIEARGRGEDSDVALELGGGGTGSSTQIPPALVLQFMYYRQLASLDIFFSSRYDEMMDRYMNTSLRISPSLAREFQHLNTSRLVINQSQAPSDKSSITDAVFEIPAELYAYRFFDEEMNPYLRVYFEENTDEAITFEELRRHNNLDEIRYEDYELARFLSLYDMDGNLISQLSHRSSVAASEQDPIERNMATVMQDGTPGILEAHTELHNIPLMAEGGMAENFPIRSHLKGIGSSAIEIGSPYSKDDFIASDIILGYTDPLSENGFDYQITHSGNVPENSNMMFYYEAYNIPQAESGLYTFSLDYNISRDRSFLRRLVSFGSSGYSITIENSTDRPHFTQLLEIVSEELRRGNYTLQLAFSSDSMAETYTREVKFRID